MNFKVFLKPFSPHDERNCLGSFLFFLNSILLGIWALKHTIALRNMLLIVGAIVSLAVIRREVIIWQLKKY